ncbi:MAG: hypothetical protein ACQGVC_09190 [Myxococcota bacterium]
MQMLRSSQLLDLRNLFTAMAERGTRDQADRICSAVTGMILDSRSADSLPPAQVADVAPLRALCPASLLTSVLTLQHASLVQGLPISIDLDIDYSARRLRQAINVSSDYDMVALPLTSAASYLASSEDRQFEPVAILPRGGHRLMAHSLGAEVPGSVLLPGNGTASGYLADLNRYRCLDVEKLEILVCEPADTMSILSAHQAPIAGVVWSPLNLLLETVWGATNLDPDGFEPSSRESVLLMRGDVLRDGLRTSEIVGSIQRAVDLLAEDEELVHALTKVLFADSRYLTSLERATSSG